MNLRLPESRTLCVSYFQNGPAVASDNSSDMALTLASKYRCGMFVTYLRSGAAVDSYDHGTNRMQLTTVKTTGWKCRASLTRLSMVYGFLGQKWLNPIVQ